MPNLTELAERRYTSIGEVSGVLNELSIARLEDSQLVQMGEGLLRFPTIIDEVSIHPAYYKKGFDLVAYYDAVKGRITPKLADGQVQRLIRLRSNLTRYAQQHQRLAQKPHEVRECPTHSLSEVEEYFQGLDVYDGRRLTAVLDGATLALHCPDIVPGNAIRAFGHRWYTAKQFHGDYEYGVKTAMDLREDGRRDMFLEGISNLNRYLRTNSH